MAEHKLRRGQATVEFALLYGTVMVPLLFGFIYLAQLLWVWHSIVEFTRDGARYAATHCWAADGQNVIQYMQTNVPANIDQAEFQLGGSAAINARASASIWCQERDRDAASGGGPESESAATSAVE